MHDHRANLAWCRPVDCSCWRDGRPRCGARSRVPALSRGAFSSGSSAVRRARAQMIAEIPILWQKIAPVLLLAALIVLSGCATLTEQQIYMDWIAIANPAAICAGAPYCVQHSTYRGKKMCTI